MTPNLSLRPGRREDAYALWLWANDPETRAAAFDRPAIPWSEHVRWLDEHLASSEAIVIVAFLPDDQPVGSIRFDTKDGWRTTRLSYVIAAEARGSGYGKALVERGFALLRKRHPTAGVIATVRAGNEASLRIFRQLGWKESQSPERPGEEFVFSSGDGVRR